MSVSTTAVSNLFRQVWLLKSKHQERAKANGENFNIFSILGRETDEVKTHSALLADLLSPTGSHGQGAVFLKLFIEKLSRLKAYEDVKNFQVHAEKSTPEGKIDILLEKDDACIVIENKIYAGDQENQLQRYYDYACSKVGKGQVKIIYLTLHGDDPRKYSLGNLNNRYVIPVSYESDIIDWLKDCIKESEKVPIIRETLVQYQILLQKLTGKLDGSLSMEIKDILKEKQQDGRYNFLVLQDIEQAMNDLRVELQLTFWEKLKEKLNQLEETRDFSWKLFRKEKILWNAGGDEMKSAGEDTIQASYIKQREKFKYGLNFRIDSNRICPPFKENLVLRIQTEDDLIVYGFMLMKRSEAGEMYCTWGGKEPRLKNDPDFHSCQEKLMMHVQIMDVQKSIGKMEFDKWCWLTRKWPKDEILVHGPRYDSDMIPKLADEGDDVVDELVEEIRKAVDAVVRAAASGQTFDTQDVAAHFNRSRKNVRRALRKAGYGVGSGNRYSWTEVEFNKVIKALEKNGLTPIPVEGSASS